MVSNATRMIGCIKAVLASPLHLVVKVLDRECRFARGTLRCFVKPKRGIIVIDVLECCLFQFDHIRNGTSVSMLQT